MKPETIRNELRDAGWTSAETGDGILWISADSNYDREERDQLRNWIAECADRWREEGRGQRNTVRESPFGPEKWFVKQYHHGGLLAESGDVTYQSPERFLAELKAVLLARRNGMNVPDPRAIYYEEKSNGYVGYFVSSYVESDPMTRKLRNRQEPSLARRAGEALAQLHHIEIDHQDYHVGNLRVDRDDKLLLTDFDPVEFDGLSDVTRQHRRQRFVRSLTKHGFTDDDVEAFKSGYRHHSGSNGESNLINLGVRVGHSVKNTLSDVLYWGKDRPLENINLEKILVRAPNWLGDAVMSLPLLEALSEHESNPIVDVVARESVSPIYENHAVPRKIHTLSSDKEWTLPDVRGERYSLLITIPKSLRTGLQAFLSGIPRRVGFATQNRSMFLTDRVPLEGDDRQIHHARLYFKLLEDVLEEPDELTVTGLSPPDHQDRPTPKTAGPQDRLTPKTDYLTFHPGSAYGPAKRWPPDLFGPFLKTVLENTDYTLVALGVEDERPIAQKIIDHLDRDRVVNLVGETSLEEVMTVLNHSNGTLANDSGIMHLSAALGTPTLGIFGSSSPDLTSPIGKTTDYLYENVECSPCFERTCPLDEDRYKCLRRINSDKVVNRFLSFMKNSD
jgi:heptosyltransferase-2